LVSWSATPVVLVVLSGDPGGDFLAEVDVAAESAEMAMAGFGL
jgi:hypothetical protein